MKKKSLLLGAVLALSSIVAACSDDEKANSASGDDWNRPSRLNSSYRLVLAADGIQLQELQQKCSKNRKSSISELAAVNKPGGGGAIGWAYIDGKKTDNHLLFPTSPPIMFVPLNGQSDLGHKDFTPIAGLTADYAAYIVKADSPFQDMNDLAEAMKKDPTSV